MAVAVLIVAVLGMVALAVRVNETLHLLAVSLNGAGEVIDANIWVSLPGSGLFTVYPAKLVGRDTALSARLALTYSAMLHHLDPETVDGGVEFETVGSVSGASAGLAFLSGYYALLHNSVLNSSVYAFTGLITPSGLVAAVGGLAEKVAAAKSIGIKTVFVPLEASAFNLTVSGVRIIRVCSFADVVSRLYNVTILSSSAAGDRLFCNASRELVSILDSIIAKHGEELSNTTLLFIEVRLNQTRALARRGMCYAAASVAYSTLALLTDRASKSLLRELIEIILAKVNRSVFAARLYAVKTWLLKARYIPLWRLEAILAALYRFYAAVKLLESSDLRLKALGALRLLTARQWLDVAGHVEGPLVRASVVKRALSLLVSYATLSYQYLESLAHRKQVSIENAEHLRLKRLVSDMQMYYVKGDWLTAGALALEVLDTVNRVIVAFDLQMGAPPWRLASCGLRQAAFNQYIAGYRSLISTLLVEYGAAVNDTLGRALIFADASSYALLPLAIAVYTEPTVSSPRASCGVNAALLSATIGLVIVAGGVLSSVIFSKKIE